MPRNLFMSLWLSAANRAANTGRAMLTAQMRRQQAQATTQLLRNMEHVSNQVARGAPATKRPKAR